MIDQDQKNQDENKNFQINKTNNDLIIKYIEKIINLNFNKQEDDYNPINEKAREIAEKLKESHKKIQELKNKNGEDYFYAKVINLLRGTGYFDMKTLLDMTIYQLVQTYQRFSLYDGRQVQTIYHAAGAEIKDFIAKKYTLNENVLTINNKKLQLTDKDMLEFENIYSYIETNFKKHCSR